MSTITESGIETEVAAISCGECGIAFSVPAWWRTERLRDHRTWYCPNGHPRAYNGETNEERRIRELEAEKQKLQRWHADARQDATIEREARKSVERRLSATKGVLTRTKNRVARGVCPCCNRSFSALARHMATQHPEYTPAPTGATPEEG
jgi:hypothetical protein